MTTTFTLMSFREFKRTLGKMNAVVECAELAFRKFIQEAATAPDQSAWVKQISTKFAVKVDKLDIPLLKQLVAQFHIASVHQEFEMFLKDAAHELLGEAVQRSQDESLLKATLVALFGNYGTAISAIGRVETEIPDYYRLVRNAFAHSGDEGIVKKDVKSLRTLIEQHGGTLSRLNAPNEFSTIQFDDFILFSRAVKTFGTNLCKSSRPPDADIVTMITRLDGARHRNVNFKKLKAQNPTPERLNRALLGLLRTLYSLSSVEAEPIIRLLTEGPLA